MPPEAHISFYRRRRDGVTFIFIHTAFFPFFLRPPSATAHMTPAPLPGLPLGVMRAARVRLSSAQARLPAARSTDVARHVEQEGYMPAKEAEGARRHTLAGRELRHAKERGVSARGGRRGMHGKRGACCRQSGMRPVRRRLCICYSGGGVRVWRAAWRSEDVEGAGRRCAGMMRE